MLATADRATAIKMLTVEHDEIRHIIDSLTDAQMDRPDTIRYGLYSDQQCSFKDLVSHLLCYELYTVQAVRAWRDGKKHPILDTLATGSGRTHVHYNEIDIRRSCSLHEVLGEWEQVQSDLMATIEGISEADWKQPAPYPTNEPTDLGGMIEGILVLPPRPMYRHLPVHIPDSEIYIQRLKGVS